MSGLSVSWTRPELEGCTRNKLRSRAMDLRDALGESEVGAPLPSTTGALVEWILSKQAHVHASTWGSVEKREHTRVGMGVGLSAYVRLRAAVRAVYALARLHRCKSDAYARVCAHTCTQVYLCTCSYRYLSMQVSIHTFIDFRSRAMRLTWVHGRAWLGTCARVRGCVSACVRAQEVGLDVAILCVAMTDKIATVRL